MQFTCSFCDFAHFSTPSCFLSSGQGETVVSILTDMNGFVTYENREFLLAESQDLSAQAWQQHVLCLFSPSGFSFLLLCFSLSLSICPILSVSSRVTEYQHICHIYCILTQNFKLRNFIYMSINFIVVKNSQCHTISGVGRACWFDACHPRNYGNMNRTNSKWIVSPCDKRGTHCVATIKS